MHMIARHLRVFTAAAAGLIAGAMFAGLALRVSAQDPPPPCAPAPPAPNAVTVRDQSSTFAVAVLGFQDPAIGTNQFNRPMGRFVVVDWSVTNTGTEDADLNVLRLVLRTTDQRIYRADNPAGVATPTLSVATLAPGETVRGYVVYDLPTDATIEAALYQPLGAGSVVIASP
jgi:hypothetical protein